MIGDLTIDSLYAAGTGRKMYLQRDIDDYDEHGRTHRSTPRQMPLERANLVSSEVESGKHMPVIDFDFPARIIPSSTEGHGHLYIDQELTWEQYLALLEGFHKAGLIQDGWLTNAMSDKRTYVRLPHVSKRTNKTERAGKASDWQLDPDAFDAF